MKLDKYLEFCTDQALATAVSDNVLDLLSSGDDLSRTLNVFAKVEGGTMAGGTSMTAKLQTSADNSTFEDLVTYPAATLAVINATGYIVPPTPLPSGLKRYLRLDLTASGTFTGDGKILAGLTPSFDKLT